MMMEMTAESTRSRFRCGVPRNNVFCSERIRVPDEASEGKPRKLFSKASNYKFVYAFHALASTNVLHKKWLLSLAIAVQIFCFTKRNIV